MTIIQNDVMKSSPIDTSAVNYSRIVRFGRIIHAVQVAYALRFKFPYAHSRASHKRTDRHLADVKRLVTHSFFSFYKLPMLVHLPYVRERERKEKKNANSALTWYGPEKS